MKIFLTSSPTLGWAGDLNPANGMLDELRKALPWKTKCVMVTSYPDNQEITDRMAWELRECFERADLAFAHYEVLDRRTAPYAQRMIMQANFLIFCGGHVPTEHAFFEDVNLRKLLKNWDGVIMTISAGSMNCAEIVYSTPEYDGEAIDPHYQLHMRGLGLTKVNILPHFQTLKDCKIDGFRLVDDIIARDSWRHPVYCLPDGSYFYITDTVTELRGEAWCMKNGKLKLVCKENQFKKIKI